MSGCKIEGCSGEHKGLGLCAKHYQELKRREKGTPLLKVRGTCSVEWCDSPCHAHGLCSNHYQIKKRNGSPTAYHRARNGMGTQGPGPRMISTERGQEYEHIVFCRREYGELPEGFVIHHLDGNPQNNDLENLVVCSGQSQHMRLHWWQHLLAEGVQPAVQLPATAVPEKVMGHPRARWEHIGMLFTDTGEYVAVPALPGSYGLGTYSMSLLKGRSK